MTSLGTKPLAEGLTGALLLCAAMLVQKLSFTVYLRSFLGAELAITRGLKLAVLQQSLALSWSARQKMGAWTGRWA